MDIRSLASSSARRSITMAGFLAVASVPAFAQFFTPGNLVVSRTVYDGLPLNVKIGTILPPNCATTLGACAASTGAPYDGNYPTVFNNDLYDGSFGITTKIYLDELTGAGDPLRILEVPNSSQHWVPKNKQLVTSFASKSELGLNLTDDGKFITFMGYVAPVGKLDISNSSTPLAIDPTNPDGQTTYRAVARVNRLGEFVFTVTNAYSGNNGRAAILNDTNPGHPVYYTTGNAGNGANPQPFGVVAGAGAQLIPFVGGSELAQNPGFPTPIGSFSVTQLPGTKPDKIGKDDNFRGMTTFNNVLYYTKGSGGNGVNTVYFVDTVGGACPNGVGLPKPGATLPTRSLPYNPATLATTGLPSNMCILAGFPSTLAGTKGYTPMYPFGLFFADANTLYVADEGDGFTKDATLYTHAAAQTTAGLQKWVFNPTDKLWKLAYTIQTGLSLGTPYTVTGYPTGNNPATNLPWTPATAGLRNIAGLVLPQGVVAVWGITSTVSGNGDVGADPNQLVVMGDFIANTDPAEIQGFIPLKTAHYGEVLRGVTFTPGTDRASFLTLPQ